MSEHLYGPLLADIYANLDPELKSCSVLWRAVVSQAVRDLTLVERKPDGSPDEDRIASKLEAAKWIGSIDFHRCCAFALMEPDLLESELRSILAQPDPYRRARLIRLADWANERAIHDRISSGEQP